MAGRSGQKEYRFSFLPHFPPIAQLVEQLPFKEMVPGSNPGGRTKVRNTCPAAGFLLLSEPERCRVSRRDREAGSRPNPSVGEGESCDDKKNKPS